MVLVSRFANPKGVFGESFHNPLDASQAMQPVDLDSWSHWKVPDNFSLSIESPGQTWRVYFYDVIETNIILLPKESLPRNCFSTRPGASEDVAAVFVIEGALFGSSGIAEVQ